MEGESGRTVIVTGRDGIDKQMTSGKYPNLIRVAWRYNALPDGMPEEGDAELMGRVNDAFIETFRRDKAAWLVAIITGDGCRDWMFYTGNLGIFNKIFNRALEPLDLMPLVIEAQEDPDWEEYLDMRNRTYIPPEEK